MDRIEQYEENNMSSTYIFLKTAITIIIIILFIICLVLDFTEVPKPNNWNKVVNGMDIKNVTEFVGTPDYISNFYQNKTKQTRYGWYLIKIVSFVYLVDTNENKKVVKIIGPLRELPPLPNN